MAPLLERRDAIARRVGIEASCDRVPPDRGAGIIHEADYQIAMIEIKFRGRGGQGAVVAAEILGKSFFLEGKWPQAFSLFGSERRGAPVFGFLRVDDRPILLKCQIRRPDQVIVFDPALAGEEEVFGELKNGGVALINTREGIERFKDWRAFRIGLVDAASIARDLGLHNTYNTAILGAYVRLTGLLKMETLLRAVREMVPAKIEPNIQAALRSYETVQIHLPEER